MSNLCRPLFKIKPVALTVDAWISGNRRRAFFQVSCFEAISIIFWRTISRVRPPNLKLGVQRSQSSLGAWLLPEEARSRGLCKATPFAFFYNSHLKSSQQQILLIVARPLCIFAARELCAGLHIKEINCRIYQRLIKVFNYKALSLIKVLEVAWHFRSITLSKFKSFIHVAKLAHFILHHNLNSRGLPHCTTKLLFCYFFFPSKKLLVCYFCAPCGHYCLCQVFT